MLEPRYWEAVRKSVGLEASNIHSSYRGVREKDFVQQANTMPSVKRVHVDELDTADRSIIGGDSSARSRLQKPLSYSGSLDGFKHQDLTPVIGREYEGLQVTDLLKWGDERIRDLAVTSSSSFPDQIGSH